MLALYRYIDRLAPNTLYVNCYSFHSAVNAQWLFYVYHLVTLFSRTV